MEYAERAAEKSEPRRRGGLLGLGWLCILLVAWVVFDLTASDSLTAVVVCSKLGWDDWLTAIWLYRRDPRRVRAVVCSWFFIASGLWKMTVSAFAAMIALVVIHAGQGAPDAFGAVVLSLFFSLGGSSLLTLAASWLAFNNGVKVWSEWRVRQARRDGVWPPVDYCRCNRAGFLLITSFVAVGTPTMLAVVLGAAFLINPWMKQKNDVALVGVMAFFLLLMSLLVVAVLRFKDFVERQIAASTPEGCWGETFDDHQETYLAARNPI